ncbi:hypothetical protein [Streptomyces sp. NPDC059452]|uniref:hypothetical protein n=1 Tax=Streptomyces sp. NPDC059452 TaxID=3346835 RepID=UPI0036B3910F
MPVLEVAAGIGEVDYSTAKDACVCVVRIDQAERDLSTGGLMVTTERGTVKNGAATIVAQYRSQLSRLHPGIGPLAKFPHLYCQPRTR